MTGNVNLCATCARNRAHRFCTSGINIFPYAYGRCVSYIGLQADEKVQEEEEKKEVEEKKTIFFVYSTDDPKKVIRYAKLP